MKKLITIFAAMLMTASVFAQAPQKMSYQAVIRNASNALITSTTVGMRISILQGSSSGAAVYIETQTISTNANGLVSLEVGTGTIVTGTFAGINWANGPYFIKTETDPTGGTAYTIAGTNELMSVPYALFSANGSGWGLTGNAATATDFIGTTNPVPFNIKVNNVKAGRIDSAPLYNAFYGYQSGLNTSTGVDNTGIGTNALSFNTTGINNTATGRSALQNNTGSNNTADGKSALQNNTTGIGNTASGLNALHSNISGNFNTAVGYTANVSSGALTNATAIGNGAIVTASNEVRIGNANVDALYFGTANNLPTTTDTPNMVYDSSNGQIMRSTTSLVGATGPTGATGATGPAGADLGTHWTLTGNAATATDFIGTTNPVPFNIKVNNVKAGRIDSAPLYNAFYGYQSGLNTSTGVDNTGIGTNALSFNTTGINNTATGRSALQNNTGSNNTADGKSALQNNTTGIGNTASGLNALHSNISGNFNTAYGYQTLDSNTTGSNNTAIGYGADVSTGAFTNATAIGYNAKVAASNSLILGGTGVDEVNVGVGTTNPVVKLDVEQGTLRVNRKTSDHTNPHVRVSDDDNSNDFGGISNATGVAGFFIPSFTAKSNVAGWLGSGDASNTFITVNADDNQTPSRRAAMAFDARNYDNTGPLLQKDLFSWGSFVGGSGGATYMSMDHQGNLGIGTTTPGAKLEVNGTVKITDGSQGLDYVLTSDAVGLASWKPIPPATGGGCGTCHFIGESYGGGVVYYIYDGGQHGLIIANNYSEVPWWNGTPRFTGTTGDGVNAGAMNTTLIVAAQYADNPTTGNFAAKVCADFIAGGFGDWYLPSKMELNLLFLQKDNLPGLSFIPQWQYWSSTEFNATEAENQLFDSGTQQHNSKGFTGIARAVRSF